MSLEQNQLIHNTGIVAAGNASASLDPKEVLILGARKLAAGAELGMSTEEVLSRVSREARAERRAIGPQRQTLVETQNDIIRRAMQARQQLGKPIEGRALRPKDASSFLGDPSELMEKREEGSPAAILETAKPGDRNYVETDIREEREARSGRLAENEERV